MKKHIILKKSYIYLFIFLSLSVDCENYVSLIFFSAPGIAIGLHLALYKLLLNKVCEYLGFRLIFKPV